MQILKVLLFSAALSPVLAMANPPEPPIFTGCPTEVTGNHCDSLLYSVVAIDPNSSQPGYSRNVRYHLVSGPGEINTKTGLWKWFPEQSDGGQSYLVEIAASAHDTITTGSENCSFWVNVSNSTPEIDGPRHRYAHIEVGQTAAETFTVIDQDQCDVVTIVDFQSRPNPTGAVSVDSVTGHFAFTPGPADNNRRFEFFLEFSDGYAIYYSSVLIDVGVVPPADEIKLRIQNAQDIPLGATIELPVCIDSSIHEMRLMYLMIAYDSNALSLEDVLPGQFFDECEWDYLQSRSYNDPSLHWFDPALAGVRIILSSDAYQYPGEAACRIPSAFPAELFKLRFTVTDDIAYKGAFLPIRFFWHYCPDNRIELYSESQYLLADVVRDPDGNLLPTPNELPSFDGIPFDCDLFPFVHRGVSFQHGMVRLIGSEPVAIRGDCNMDGIAWTPEDRSYFAGYFYGGCPIAYCGCSDPNLDGVPNHISDYWFVFNVVHYSRDPEIPVPALSNQEVRIFDDTLHHHISIANADSICGFFAIFDGIVEFPFMSYEYFHIWNDGDKTYAVANLPVIIPDKATNYDYFLEDGLLFEYSGGKLLEVQASTCAGVRMPVRIITGPAPFQVVIETEVGPDSTGVTPGTFQQVDVKLTHALEPIGGFSLLMAYDASMLSFAGAETDSSPLYTDCAWEYFSYRTGSNGNCEGDCPSGLVSVTGIAETNDGPHHPEICNLAEFDNPILFTLEFLISAGVIHDGWLPIDFFWVDCTDNIMSNWTGDTLLMSNRVLRRTSYSWQNPDDEASWQDVTDYLAGFPTYGGAQAECTINPDPNRPEPASLVEFIGGGIFVQHESTISRGDLNLDGIAYTIADAVIFARCLVYGDTVFLSIPGVQFPLEAATYASDINADGDPFTIEDFVCLIRVIYGDAVPYPPQDPAPHPVTFTLSEYGYLSYEGEYDLGAVRIVYEGDCAPSSLLDQMEIEYYTSGDSTVVLLYSFDGEYIGANHGHLMDLMPGGCATIRSVVAADYWGRAVQCIYDTPTDVGDETENLPDQFALEQNYPNPFNPATTIEFALPVAADTRITIYNIQGQIVRTLADTHLPAGYHAVVWNGLDNYGNTVASGVYLYRIDADGFVASRKMLLLK